MDLRQLKYFVAIARHGSFSKAANHLRIAQPALSQHVRNMEDELGLPLLHRLARGVVTTEAGERLLVRANAILSDFDALPDFVRGEAEAPAGPVHLGLPGTVSEILALPLIETALERYPLVQIRVAEAMSGFVLEWLRRGEIDLAVIYSEAPPSGVRTVPLLSEQLHLFAAPSLAEGMPESGTEIGVDPALGLARVAGSGRGSGRESGRNGSYLVRNRQLSADQTSGAAGTGLCYSARDGDPRRDRFRGTGVLARTARRAGAAGVPGHLQRAAPAQRRLRHCTTHRGYRRDSGC
jgi:DNA-binding transcriptional LysR family regulator